MFDLKRPCTSCPFRRGQGELFRLNKDRLSEIVGAPAFQCHKTVDYTGDDEDDDGNPISRAGDRPQQCAGLMALLRNVGIPNQIMQVAERLGALDPAELDPRNEAYSSFEEAMRAHGCYS